jgi:hypothetical protein
VRTGLQTEKIIAAARHIIADAEQAAIIDFLSYLTPRRSVKFGKIRLGRNGDGGYILLDDFSSVSAALSFGISTECSWDIAIAERDIDVYQYDHTIDGPPTANARFQFFRKRIAAVSSDQTESLGSALAKPPSTAERVILKIDIEGAEWDVFDAATSEELVRFAQIVEFHGFDNVADSAWRDAARRVLAKLRSVFDVVQRLVTNHPTQSIIERCDIAAGRPGPSSR